MPIAHAPLSESNKTKKEKQHKVVGKSKNIVGTWKKNSTNHKHNHERYFVYLRGNREKKRAWGVERNKKGYGDRK